MTAPTDPIPPPTDQTPEAKLTRNIRQVCRRVVRGKAAAGNWQVTSQLFLRIASVVLSSLGSAGVIVDKVSGNLPNETGWAFWGSVVVLLFGILLQVANEFRIAQIASDSRLLAEQCALCETQLENMLIDENPMDPVAGLLRKLIELTENARYNTVLPAMTPEMEARAESWATTLISANKAHWQLVDRRPRRTGSAKSSLPEPPGPSGSPKAG
ncbi:MAG: hypothetical protein J0I06_12370 [Planctomycetes bacterium]|nr:hypothetical protein [Planctomycetota bacterium]